MIETKEFVASNGKAYYLHHFPATKGLAIHDRMKAINGDPDKKEEFTLRVMPYVSVKPSPKNPKYELPLDTEIAINNHITEVKVLMEVIEALLAWNFDFLSRGEISACLNLNEGKVAGLQNTEMWTGFLGALLKADAQLFTNSKPSTRSKMRSKSGKA